MMGGLTIMLGVFINLLYIYTLPNNHYSTTYMQLYPHLMAKHWLKVGRKLSWESPGHVLDMSLDDPFVLYFAGHRQFEGQEDNFTDSFPHPALSLDFSH